MVSNSSLNASFVLSELFKVDRSAAVLKIDKILSATGILQIASTLASD